MHRLKIFYKTVVLWFLISSSACVSSQTNTQVFECSASKPKSLEISINQQNNHLELAIFNLASISLSQPETLAEFSLDQYHRSLVDEKSLEFTVGERSILVSEYHSEEFGEKVTILSVTLKQDGRSQYFECEKGSSSNLILLFQE